MNGLDLVVAADRNYGIGKDGKLPWRLPKELKYFRSLTTTTANPNLINAVIMGRKTWESIPEKNRPLRDRVNVVLTRSKNGNEFPDGIKAASSLSEALEILGNDTRIDRAFVIGGEKVYSAALATSELSRIFLTEIDAEFECDTFLSDLAQSRLQPTFKQTSCSDDIEEEGCCYRYRVFERR